MERWFESVALEGEPPAPPNTQLVSSIAVVQAGAHERVRVWSRGGLAGELVVSAGDGEQIAAALGLREKANLG